MNKSQSSPSVEDASVYTGYLCGAKKDVFTLSLAILRLLLLVLVFGLLSGNLLAQTPYVVIGKISFQGNKKTRENIMLREMTFQVGDTLPLPELMPALLQSKQLLLNSLLFNSVVVNVANWDTSVVDVKVDVVESWYIFPLPVVELADRNFNVWWKEHNHSLRRLNLGLNLVWENLTGRGDVLKSNILFGYSRKFELEYRRPYINNKKTLGLLFNALYSSSREILYDVKDNEQLFVNDFQGRSPLFQRWRGNVNLTWRPLLRAQHIFGLGYLKYQVADTTLLLNPLYFTNSETELRYPWLSYRLFLDRRDNRPYPRRGFFLDFRLQKEGIGWQSNVTDLWASAAAGRYFPLTARMHLSLEGKVKKTFFPHIKQPFLLQTALGYRQDFVRGYEYYVVNGQDYALIKSEFQAQLIKYQVPVSFSPIKTFRSLPVQIYGRVHNDFGYVADRFYQDQNPLANQLLWGAGIGIDFIVFYDNVFQADISINKRGETGLYFRFKTVL